jgi:hypothetical protein
MGKPVNENFVRDTVNVPYYNAHSLAYPSIRVRMDFRDPNMVGTFPYHCHLLEHEDKGMMGSIQVVPQKPGQSASDRAFSGRSSVSSKKSAPGETQ